jgi:hypothetical protein
MLPGQAYPLYWNTVMAMPWTTIADAFRHSADGGGVIAMNGLALLAFASVAALRPARPDYALYVAGTVGLLLTADARPPLHSVIRYVLPIFPSYPALARLVRFDLILAVLLVGSAFVQVAMLFAFWDWYFLV